MKRCSYLLCLIVLIPQICFAYTQLDTQKKGTHYALTEHAIKQSNIEKYLNDYLDIKLDDQFTGTVGKPIDVKKPTAQEWIQYGGDWEDVWDDRCLNHFYDPTTGQGLIDYDVYDPVTGNHLLSYTSALNWAKEGYKSDWAWKDARQYFYRALSLKTDLGDTSTDPKVRETNLAKTFRAVGQIVHLLQDMAVPAHTRNDMHIDKFDDKLTHQIDMYERYAAYNIGSLPFNGYAPALLSALNKFDDFWHTDGKDESGKSIGKGLADFTNRNFVSRDTNFDDKKPYTWPVAENRVQIEQQIRSLPKPDPEHDTQIVVNVKYATGTVTDSFTGSAPINHLAAYSYFDYESQKFQNEPLYSLNWACHKEYLSFLIPRATAYSAGLLKYFFRGTLEVTNAYNVEGDGAKITKITADVKNTTLNNNVAEEASNGEVFAFARYKATADATEYSYAVSTSAVDADGQQITSLSRENPNKLVFDFSNSTLPVGAQDINLHVVFYGTLGHEEETGIAIGVSKVSDLYVLMNVGYYYTLLYAGRSSVVKTFQDPKTGNIIHMSEIFKINDSSDNSYQYLNEYFIENDITSNNAVPLYAVFMGNQAIYNDEFKKLIPIYTSEPLTTSGQTPTYEYSSSPCYVYSGGGYFTMTPLNGTYEENSKYSNKQGLVIDAYPLLLELAASKSYTADYILEDYDYEFSQTYNTSKNIDDQVENIPSPSDYSNQDCAPYCNDVWALNDQTMFKKARKSSDESLKTKTVTRTRYTPFKDMPLYSMNYMPLNKSITIDKDESQECKLYVNGGCGINPATGLCTISTAQNDDHTYLGNDIFSSDTVTREFDDIFFMGYHAVVHKNLNLVLQYYYSSIHTKEDHVACSNSLCTTEHGEWSVPEHYFQGQLNFKQGLYTDKINFDLKSDIKHNESFERISLDLIQQAFDNRESDYGNIDSYPPGYSATFMKIKEDSK